MRSSASPRPAESASTRPRKATPAPMARSSSLAGSPSSKKSWPAWGRSPTASVEVSALSLRNAVQVLLRPTSTASRLGAKSLSDAAPVRNATVTDGLASEPASVQTAATMTSAGTPSRSVGPLTVSVWFAASKSRVASPVVTPGKPVGATGRTTDVALRRTRRPGRSARRRTSSRRSRRRPARWCRSPGPTTARRPGCCPPRRAAGSPPHTAGGRPTPRGAAGLVT